MDRPVPESQLFQPSPSTSMPKLRPQPECPEPMSLRNKPTEDTARILPIVSIVVPFFGLTKYIIRLL